LVKILENTPFGFVMELEGDKAYFSGDSYEVYVNEAYYGVYEQNVISLFGLKPNRLYKVKIHSEIREFCFEIRTKEIGYLINICDYNAAGDGMKDDTSAINTAIYTAPRGSVVYVPAGEYMVSQIYLKSGVDIYLEKGSRIRQNTDRSSLSILKGYQKDYYHMDATVNASWEGNPLDTYCGVFFGYEVEDVRIYGAGMIDGSGEEGGWWEHPKLKKAAFRPRNVFLNCCRNITISGITSRNSACWNIHPFYSEKIRIYHVRLESPKDSPNTDGINPESCRDVKIIGCRFEVGDDCIAVKAGKYFMSRYSCRPCEDIYVANCYMGDGHGGVAVGSEISCGVKNLTVERCYMDGTDRGIRIKTRRGRGSTCVVDHIRLSGIIMKNVQHCISMNMFYNCDPDGSSDYVKNKQAARKDTLTPEIKRIELRQIEATDIRGCAIFMYGLPESRIGTVQIDECSFTFADNRECGQPEMLDDFEEIADLGIFIRNAETAGLKANKFNGKYVSVIEEEMCEAD